LRQDASAGLVLVSVSPEVEDQLKTAGIVTVIGANSVYQGDDRVGATVQRAEQDALEWINAGRSEAPSSE
jgi:hypothetical protein